jgi:hypothetical protein
MLRKLLGTGLLLATLAGCTKLEGATCTSDADCASVGGLCDTAQGICYAAGTDVCTPACAEYEGCTKDGCKPGFTRVVFLTPANNALVRGGTIEVSARLEVEPTFADVVQYPDRLIFAATRDDGGDVGSFGTVTRNGNVYTAQWTAPSGQAQLTLTAAHPVAAANVPGGTLTVRVDTVPPTFDILFPSAPARLPGSTGQADEKDPDPLYGTAFRRDEPVTVMVSANEPVINVTLKVMGVAAGGGEGAAMAPVAVQPGGTCDGSPPFCGTATVNLSLPEMREFRGTMQFLAEGTDAAGNPGSVKEGLKVTRWKWAFDGLGPIKVSPAVGEKGVVYFGTAATTGKVFAIEPSGKKKWEVDVEAVEGSPAVGAFNNDTELVYVASNFTGLAGIGSGARLRAINGADGAVVSNSTCTLSVTAGTPPVVNSAAAIATTSVSGTPVETALVVVSGSHRSAVGMRPTSVGSTTIGCVNSDSSQGMPESSLGGGLVARGNGQFAYPTVTRRIVRYTFGNPSEVWTATPGGGSGQQVFGMALLGDNLLGSGGNSFDQGGVFQVPFDSTGNVAPGSLSGTEGGRVYQFAAGADNQAYFGREFSSPSTQLVRYTLSPPGVAKTVDETGVITAAPVLGGDGRLYTLSKTGEVAVWSASDLASQWKTSLSATNVEASPTLDCARNPDGTPAGQNLPGVLYVAVGNKLHALVVDSPSLFKDSNSWPKYQHDARNTGNPATPVTNCP